MTAQPSLAIGVDFGTTTSFLGEGRPGRRPIMIGVGRSTLHMPSLVGVDADVLQVGEAAEDLGAGRFARSIKRAITMNQTTRHLDDGTEIDVDQAVEAFLHELGRRSREYVDLSPDSIRLGCPAMWTGPQRQRLLGLAQAAGLPAADHTLIDEPVAAGVAWVRNRVQMHAQHLEGKVLVFDMGGGTLDVAVLEIDAGPGRDPDITVLSSVGDDEAGDRLDETLQDLLAYQLGIDIAGDDLASRLLHGAVLNEARGAKLMLSDMHVAHVAVRTGGGVAGETTIERLQLEDAFADQLERARRLVLSALRASRLTHAKGSTVADIMNQSDASNFAEINYVLLAGGMSRVPAVKRMLATMFGHAEMYDESAIGISADEIICAGLSDPESYDRINLNRPAFDFVLVHGDTEELLYEAYSPIYDRNDVHRKSIVQYEHEIQVDGRIVSEGHMEVRSSGGAPVRLRSNNHSGDVLPVAFGHKPVRFVLYPHGTVMLFDGRGRHQSFRVESWPAIRAANHAQLVLAAIDKEPPPVPRDLGWNYRFNDGQ